jgi:hypothetical protein
MSSTEMMGPPAAAIAASSSKTASNNNNKEQSESAETLAESTVEVAWSSSPSVELLLCLRPIRDGDEKVDEKFRFEPGASRRPMVSESSSGPGSGQGSGEASGPSSDENPSSQQDQQQRLSKSSKKRAAQASKLESSLPAKKRRRGEHAAKQLGDTTTGNAKSEHDVVGTGTTEATMLLNNKKNT